MVGSPGCSRITEPNHDSPREALPSITDRAANSDAAGEKSGFYPLQLGNRWHYVYTYSSQFLPADGSNPEPPIVERSTSERMLVCKEEIDGREYMVERQLLKSGDRPFWVGYRQDRTGLYEWQKAPPPPCATASASPSLDTGRASAVSPREAREALESRAASIIAAVRRGSGPFNHELQRLQYPLHPGSRWDVLPKPLLSAEVEGVDVINLPTGREPAYRIRYRGETLGANDQFRVWYGRSGYLGLRGHFRYESTLPRGTFVGEFFEVLDEITLNPAPRDGPRGLSHLIPEAKEALGAVLTGEQVYYQKFATFTDAADATELRVKMGVDLTEPGKRWTFSVSDASVNGFIARAVGRGDTRADGIVVSLPYVRGQPPVWTVRRRA